MSQGLDNAWGDVLRAGLALAVCLGLGGCREFANQRAVLEGYASAGQYQDAAAYLDDPKVHAQYGSKNQVLWQMDRGAVAQALGDSDTAVQLLNEAEGTIEVQREKTLGDVVGQWVINDTAAKYIAEPYEDIYINVVKTLAQLQAGRVQGGASVEVRRMASKADQLRDQYVKYEKELKSQGGSALEQSAGLVGTGTGGEFVESPLGTYLTAVTFMKTGDQEFQRVAGKRLLDSIRLQQSLIGPVREEDFAGLPEMNPADANVLIVALSGQGPTKFAEKVGPIPLGTVPVYFELPQLRTYPSEVAAAKLEIEDGTGGAAESKSLALVEDLSSVAVENHKRALPAIYARTLIRYMAKAGISVALTEAARKQAHDNDQGWVQLAGVLAGLVVIGATEEADLRCWIFLPGQARVGLMKLPPGAHRVRVVYESYSGGAAYATEWQTINVTERGLSSVVTRYWR